MHNNLHSRRVFSYRGSDLTDSLRRAEYLLWQGLQLANKFCWYQHLNTLRRLDLVDLVMELVFT